MSNGNDGARVGTISLWASILGIVLPIVIAFLVRLCVTTNDEPYYMLCFLLFAGMELIALVTGIIGRKSSSGKAGMGISLVCIVLTALAIPMFTARRVEQRPVPAGQEQSQQGGGHVR